MAETMYDYYQSQPQYMKRIVAKKDALFGAFGEFYAKAAPDRVYLCGSGSSYHASEASQEFMEVILGVEVSVIVPSQYRSLGSARPLVIAVSQSGRSINTLSAGIYNRNRAAPFFGDITISVVFGFDNPVAVQIF